MIKLRLSVVSATRAHRPVVQLLANRFFFIPQHPLNLLPFLMKKLACCSWLVGGCRTLAKINLECAPEEEVEEVEEFLEFTFTNIFTLLFSCSPCYSILSLTSDKNNVKPFFSVAKSISDNLMPCMFWLVIWL